MRFVPTFRPVGAVKTISETAVTARETSIVRVLPPEEATGTEKTTVSPAADAAGVTVKTQPLRAAVIVPSVMSCPVASWQVNVLAPSLT